MLKTKNINIPSSWIFKHFLKLEEELIGQSITMKSPFNPNDKNPSFYLKFNEERQEYFFKDYNQKIEGNAKTFLMYFLDKPLTEVDKIVFEAFELQGGKIEEVNYDLEIKQVKTEIISYNIGYWTNDNYDYWLQYGINKKILDNNNVKPLTDLVIRTRNQGLFTVRKTKLYGYFDKYDELYKIYSPDSDFKFFFINDTVSGHCNLTYKTDYLLIMSSLKDIMSFQSLNIKNVELVTPNSETSVIPRGIINSYKIHYKKIGVLFDNDNGGDIGRKFYKDYYNIDGLNLPLSKDLSDSIKDFGKDYVKKNIIPLLLNYFK